MRIVAILATLNEERFMAKCLEHSFSQGIEVYLIDNDSTDKTVAIAKTYLGHGLIGIETLPHTGAFNLGQQLARKEQLANSIKADWFMNIDADEFRSPPRPGITLAEAFAQVEAQGFNAVNFLEFTFIPTQESPDHDHPDFQKTMRWYYPFLPWFPHRVNAWKRQSTLVELVWSAGHQLRFDGLRLCPESFHMKHYLCLSREHLLRKYIQRQFDHSEIEMGWHGWRARLRADMVKFPAEAELRRYTTDEHLDASQPRQQHYFAKILEKQAGKGP